MVNINNMYAGVLASFGSISLLYLFFPSISDFANLMNSEIRTFVLVTTVMVLFTVLIHPVIVTLSGQSNNP